MIREVTEISAAWDGIRHKAQGKGIPYNPLVRQSNFHIKIA